MSTLETLKQARALISKPEHWTRSVYARDYMGESVSAWSPHAVCWCSVGAISRVRRCSEEGDTAIMELRVSMRNLPIPRIAVAPQNYNDTHTHEEVLELFDKTIERLEKEA